MIQGLLAGALCLVSIPAMAGNRSAAAVPPPSILTASVHTPEHALRHSMPQAFMLPAGTARLQPLSPLRATRTALHGAPAIVDGTAWEPAVAIERTAYANGSYAVRDAMSRQFRPRQPRSPLGAAFVLRLDGKDDSPPFSIGGGGVAAAVWKVVPR